MEVEQYADLILKSKRLVFLTGAGVSTLSGIPDYRSMQGVYHNLENPEYLLSHTCFKNEPSKFYEFVKGLYHPNARPNIIHDVIAQLEENSAVTVITQNIDSLHTRAGSSNVIEFHGNLYNLYCTKCLKKIDANEYLISYLHSEDQGIIRPKVVLYEEMLDTNVVSAAIKALGKADTVVVVGTSLKVYPFAGLLDYLYHDCKVILINKEKVVNSRINYHYYGDAQDIFKILQNKI